VGSFYQWPLPDDAVREALARSYADGSWGRYHGPNCQRLRSELAAMHGVEHVTLCSSGTIAIELALRGLKVGAGDEVIVAAYDFPGNFRAIEAIGARPVLVDIDPRTWCLDAQELAAAVSPSMRAIIASHLHGGMANMPAIMEFAASRGLAVVEDACQSPGAIVDGRTAGTWGDAGVLSFGGSKLLTAGRGGAVVTRHADVHQRIKVFTHRGNDAFPLSELQAAVLLPQLQQLEERNQRRRCSVAAVIQTTSRYPCLQPLENRAAVSPSFYKLAWLLDPKNDWQEFSREALLVAAQAQRIPLDAGFSGFALRSSRRCRTAGDLRHSITAAEKTVILHHPVLLAGDNQLAQMIDRFDAVLRKMIGK
jgi:dTDP-4-amino-4,6-dideoxygalactose transaminase